MLQGFVFILLGEEPLLRHFARMPLTDFILQCVREVGRLGGCVSVSIVCCSLDKTLRAGTSFHSLFIFVACCVDRLTSPAALESHLGELPLTLHTVRAIWLFKDGLLVKVSCLGAAV